MVQFSSTRFSLAFLSLFPPHCVGPFSPFLFFIGHGCRVNNFFTSTLSDLRIARISSPLNMVFISSLFATKASLASTCAFTCFDNATALDSYVLLSQYRFQQQRHTVKWHIHSSWQPNSTITSWYHHDTLSRAKVAQLQVLEYWQVFASFYCNVYIGLMDVTQCRWLG